MNIHFKNHLQKACENKSSLKTLRKIDKLKTLIHISHRGQKVMEILSLRFNY